MPGIDYGLPFLYRIEEAIPVHIAGKLASGDIHSTLVYLYPLLLSSLLALEYGFYYLFCFLTGIVENPGAFQNLYFQDPTWFYLLGRLTSLVFGLATILVIYKLATKIYDRATGLLAAFLLVLFPMHFIQSRIIRVDILLIFFTSLSMLFIYSIYRFNRWRDNILAGLFAGLALASKYNGIIIIIPLLLAHIFHAHTKNENPIKSFSAGKFFAAMGMIFLTFLPAFPLIYLGAEGAVSAIQEFRISLLQSPSMASLSRSGWFFPFSFEYITGKLGGIALTCSIGLALVYFTFKRSKKELLIIVPLIVSFILVIFSTQPFLEYISPWLCLSLLLVSRLIIEIKNRFKKLLPRYIIPGLILVIIIANPLRVICKRVYLSLQTDTRTIAYRWVIDNIPEETSIALENNIPPIKNRAHEGIPVCDKFNTVNIPNYGSSLFGGKDWIGLTEKNTPSLDELVRDGVQVVIVHSDSYQGYRQFPEYFPRRLGFYQKLKDDTLLWKEIKSEPERRYGPTIRIYRITDEDLATQSHILSRPGRN